MAPARQDQKTDRLAQALEGGQLWRAKEILSGRIASAPFNADLYEQFGVLLLRMGDDVEAGKYLFLCGHRPSEHRLPIDLFLRRYSRAGWRSLVSAFPTAARRAAWSQLPDTVRQHLVELGMPVPPADEPLRAAVEKHTDAGGGWGCLILVVVAIALGLLLATMVVYFFRA